MNELDQLDSFINQIPGLLSKGLLDGAEIAWRVINNILILNFNYIIIFFLIMFALAIFVFMSSGDWSLLGKLIYNFIFLSLLYFIIYIFGSKIIVSDYFKIISFLIYVVGFYLTGKVLRFFSIR